LLDLDLIATYLIATYKQFVLFKFKFNLLIVTKCNSTVKLSKVGFRLFASRAVWRSPLSDDIRLLLYFSL